MEQSDNQMSGSIAQFYAPRLEAYDEMYAGEGSVLPHWQTLMQELDQLGREGLERRNLEAQRLLRENGVTFRFLPLAIIPKNHDVRIVAKTNASTAEVFADIQGYLALIVG